MTESLGELAMWAFGCVDWCASLVWRNLKAGAAKLGGTQCRLTVGQEKACVPLGWHPGEGIPGKETCDKTGSHKPHWGTMQCQRALMKC